MRSEGFKVKIQKEQIINECARKILAKTLESFSYLHSHVYFF